jgi:hypothetical protein
VRFEFRLNPTANLPTHTRVESGDTLMMRSMTFVSLVAAVTIIASTTLLWSRPHPVVLATAAMPSLQELYLTAGANRLPVQQMEDMSVIFSTDTSK